MVPLEGILGGLVSLADTLRPGLGPLGVSRRTAWTTVGMEGSLQESLRQNSSVMRHPGSTFPLLGPALQWAPCVRGRWVLCPREVALRFSLSETDTTGTPSWSGWGQVTGPTQEVGFLSGQRPCFFWATCFHLPELTY